MKLENDSKWLFKYLPFNLNAVKLLINNELWFGMPDIQNDPYEAEFNLKYNEEVSRLIDYRIIIQEELETIINSTEYGHNSPTGFERIEFENQLKKTIRDYLGICSMSVKYNDILMWAHYADNNEGLCIVFDKEILINNLSMDADKVSYSDSIANAKFVKSGNTGHVILDKIFCMAKLKCWEYEGEFRFVRRYNDRIHQNDLDRLESFPENTIVGIILGENFSPGNFKTLINLVYLSSIEKKFYFWKCRKNLYKQSMDVIEISDEHVNIYLSQKQFPFEHILYDSKNRLRQ
jgi:hypothetical protein